MQIWYNYMNMKLGTVNHKIGNTGKRGNFQTALMLSFEVELSGQPNRAPRLKYFSARRLQYQAYITWKSTERLKRTRLFSKALTQPWPPYGKVVALTLSPSWQDVPSFHVFGKVPHPVHIHEEEHRVFKMWFMRQKKYRLLHFPVGGNSKRYFEWHKNYGSLPNVIKYFLWHAMNDYESNFHGYWVKESTDGLDWCLLTEKSSTSMQPTLQRSQG